MDNRYALDKCMEMSDEELLIALAKLVMDSPRLYSPESLIRRGREYLAEFRPQLQEVICPREELLLNEGLQLVVVISGVLSQSFTIALANILASYLARNGVSNLCANWSQE